MGTGQQITYFLARVAAINLINFICDFPGENDPQASTFIHTPSTFEAGSWYVDQVSHKFVVIPLSLFPTSLCHHSGLELSFCQRCTATDLPRMGGTVSLVWLLGAL